MQSESTFTIYRRTATASATQTFPPPFVSPFTQADFNTLIAAAFDVAFVPFEEVTIQRYFKPS